MGARKRNRSCIYATDSEGISLSRWIFVRILLKNVTETWQTEESTERMEKREMACGQTGGTTNPDRE